MGIEARKQDILRRFQHFSAWEDRYRQLVAYGKKLSPLAKELKTDDILVPGCLAKVWLFHQWQGERLFLQADSDAAITKGIVGVLVHVYSGATAQEILHTPADFLQAIGLHDHLSMNRRNGLANMCKTIHSLGTSGGKKPEGSREA